MAVRTKPEVTLDYDGAWKWLIETFFRRLMELLFPSIAATIAWDRGFEFLDQELNQVSRGIRPRKGAVDKLVRLWMNGGAEAVVLLHIEFQAQKVDDFSLRMTLYQFRLYDKHRLAVGSLAILGDDDPAWMPGEHGWDLWGSGCTSRFRVCKLLQEAQRLRELAAAGDLLATMFCIHLDTFDRNRKAADWLTWKLEVTARLYEQGFQQAEIDDLMVFLDWLVVLPRVEAQQYEAEVEEMTKKKLEELYSPWERRVVARRDPQLREELRPQLREELRPQLREELRPQLREELRPQLREELRPQLREELRPQLREELRPQLREELRPQLREELREELIPVIRDELTQQVMMRTLLKLLAQRFAPLPEALEVRLAAVETPDALDRLLLAAAEAGTVADFEKELSRLAAG